MPDDAAAPTTTTIAHATTTTATDATPAAGHTDTREPDADRQAELHTAYEANVAASKPPYEGVRIRTMGELKWILRERAWSSDSPLPEGMQRPDLRGANLSNAKLSGAYLSGADLSGANLSDTKLSGAILDLADLSGANLSYADLSETRLTDTKLSSAILDLADLSGAGLGGAKLSAASLTLADLSGAYLSGADLSGANLREATLDKATRLAYAKLDEQTRLLDIDWQGVTLTRVANWPARLGDETPEYPPRNRKERIAAYRNAARSYRNLAIALRSQGLLIPASNYRLREQVMERKASFWSGNLLAWVFSWLLNLVAGYGERPARSLVAYLLIILSFAAAYLALGTGTLASFGLGTPDQVNTPLAALVFSITSFHGRGFFPGSGFRLDDPIIVLAAAEALFGLFIEITFIATFTRRFFGSQ